MFGYIKPLKAEMKVKEFDAFQAVYCGFCRELKSVYGPFASLTLSYDFTFIATLALGMREECNGFKKCRCTANIFKKKVCVCPNDDLKYCSAVAMELLYFKLKDDIADSGFFKKIRCYFLLPFASHARNKAKKLYPDIDKAIAFTMKKQAETEKSTSLSVDRSADATASGLAVICENLCEDITQKEALSRFGYMVGRYVYFADAFDDLEKDEKQNGFNPFIIKQKNENLSREEIISYGKEVLNSTIGEIVPSYELLEIKRYKEILDNIIYLGLKEEVKKIIDKKESANEKSL